jgi:hypothetical protein
VRTGTAALLSSAVLLAGCSTTVTGTASPAGAGAFTELLGTVDLADVDDRLDPYDVVATRTARSSSCSPATSAPPTARAARWSSWSRATAAPRSAR